MKKFFVSAIAVLALASCSTLTKTSTTIDVDQNLNSKSSADLIVSEKRISYTLVPSKAVRKGGKKAVKAFAVAEALKENGGDVLVAPQYEMKETKGLFGKKINYVIVSGYPATYKNFKNR